MSPSQVIILDRFHHPDNVMFLLLTLLYRLLINFANSLDPENVWPDLDPTVGHSDGILYFFF